MTQAKQAVNLARVSSKDQEDGYSINAQIDRLQKYCLRNDLSIIKTFTLAESSTQGGRKKFMEMIEFVKKQAETVIPPFLTLVQSRNLCII